MPDLGASKVSPLDEQERSAHWAKLSARVHGVFASGKNGCSIPWATHDQRCLMYLLEVDPFVLSYEPRPERVSFVAQGIRYEHTPAFRIQTARGPAILDAHPSTGADSERRQRRLSLLTAVYEGRGIPYRALSGAEICAEPRLGNAVWAVTRQAVGYGPEERLLITEALTRAPRTIRVLKNMLPSSFDVGAAVSCMAIRRILALDLAAPEPMEMTVSLCPRGANR